MEKVKKSINVVASLIVLLYGAFVLSGCGEDDAAATPSGLELLQANNWVITTFTLNVTAPIQDDFSLLDELESCDLDNEITFNNDNTLTLSTGVIACDGESAGDVLGSGGWRLSEDEKLFSLLLGETDAIGVEVEGFDPEQFIGLLEDMTVSTLTSSVLEAQKEQQLAVTFSGLTVQASVKLEFALRAVD